MTEPKARAVVAIDEARARRTAEREAEEVGVSTRQLVPWRAYRWTLASALVHLCFIAGALALGPAPRETSRAERTPVVQVRVLDTTSAPSWLAGEQDVSSWPAWLAYRAPERSRNLSTSSLSQ